MILKLAVLRSGALAVGQNGQNFKTFDPNVDYSAVQTAEQSAQSNIDPDIVAKKKAAILAKPASKPIGQ